MKTHTETIIENNSTINDYRRFTSEQEFVKFCQQIFRENEDSDTLLKWPETYLQGLEYVRLYCDNFTILSIPNDRKVEELEHLIRRVYNSHAPKDDSLRKHLSSVLEVHTTSHLFKYQDAPKLATE